MEGVDVGNTISDTMYMYLQMKLTESEFKFSSRTIVSNYYHPFFFLDNLSRITSFKSICNCSFSDEVQISLVGTVSFVLWLIFEGVKT